MFLKKGKKKLYKSGKNWVAALLLSAAVLSFYSAGLNQQTASAATSSQTKAVSYDKITNKQTVNYSAYVNENNRNDGLYSAPALTDVASMTSTGSAKSLNGHLVTVSEIDTTKRASTGVSYQYAKITDNNKSYWVDLRALNDSAQITSTQTVNFQAYINGDTRNDGLYSAPALTTSSSLTPLAYSKSLNKKSVMVSEIDTTKRASTGLSYQYAKITYNGKTYWVDARAVFDSITSKQTNLNYYATISETNRNDGIYEEPALTSLASMASTGSVKTFDQDSVEVLEIDTTFRNSNDQKYQYAKVTNGTNTYWVDVRALNTSGFAKITSSKTEDYSAYINEANRKDSIYDNGPALTSPTTLTASALAKTVNGDQVEVIALDTTTRSNGSQYTYLEVKDGSNTYWIDSRAVTAYNFDSITNQQTVNETATINEGGRSDGLYNVPALTSPSSLTSTGSAKDLDGQTVTILEIDTTKRASNGNTYQYAKIAYNGKTYWVDARALNNSTYSGAIMVNFEDENGNQLASPIEYTGKIGSTYQPEPKAITGYSVDLAKTGSIDLTYSSTTQTITYIYEKSTATTTDLINGQGQGIDNDSWTVGSDVQPGWYKITPIGLGTDDNIVLNVEGSDSSDLPLANDISGAWFGSDSSAGEISSYQAYLTAGQVIEMQDNGTDAAAGQGLHLEALSTRPATSLIDPESPIPSSFQDLGAGIYEVGVDIRPGNYQVADILGEGYLYTDDGTVSLDLGTGHGDTSTGTITLTTGELLTSTINGISLEPEN
ncbi:hypothetical protein X466_06000 [Oenococcus oeni S25]|uniref:GW dipeptide domain-containing protein n=10 Tax=Oenococcus oeni TaxID=1247 RepID=UPI00050F5106|nr:GW dipeptide domain-containing protein [Oenococcus oeni]KGH70188.1 hypothetical protein X466_06000 [Oenococcus oeni S25]OIL95516.1 hypothetical protein ATX47_07270 [Oenococcus oeni]